MEIIDTIKDIKTVGAAALRKDFYSQRRYSSIARQGSEGILQFPTIISNSIDLDTAQMICKALEKQYASFVQTAITMNPFLDMDKDGDAVGYLRRNFHQNMNNRLSSNDITNSLGPLLFESYHAYSDESRNNIFLFTVAEGSSPSIVMTNKKQLVSLMEGIRTDSLNDMYVPNTYKKVVVTEKSNKGINRHQKSPKNMSPTADEVDLFSLPFPSNRKEKPTFVNSDKGGKTDPKAPTPPPVNRDGSNPKPPVREKGGARDININVNSGDKGGNDRIKYELPNRVLSDNDVKKANELVPTTMHVRVILKNDDNKVQGNMDFMAGIKATMHPVPSTEIVDNVVRGIRKGGAIFKTIKWTTGETGFVKDFILNLNEIRDDVFKQTKGQSQFWNALKRRRKLAKAKRRFMMGDILPNASIVISMEEVDYIKSEYGFDLMREDVVYKIMEEYFLIGFTVVDSSSGTAHFLFDGSNTYQTVTFSGLERGDVAGRGVDFKDVLKLVQRI